MNNDVERKTLTRHLQEWKDSQLVPASAGHQREYQTGAVRENSSNKPRPDLISGFAEERLGEWLAKNCRPTEEYPNGKYPERNWEKGLPMSNIVESLNRHMMKLKQGLTDEDHLAAIMCNAMFAIHVQEMVRRGVLPHTLLDMPTYQREGGDAN